MIDMDRKIRHSMSTIIDLLQPANDDGENDYSPAEYTHLLNRFLAFDEEMSEIVCLYKDSQAKLISQSIHHCIRDVIIPLPSGMTSHRSEYPGEQPSYHPNDPIYLYE
jgi:hypothetical protein